MPSLGDLPSDLYSAIQRKGGATLFALQLGMVHFRDHYNCRRLEFVASWLARQARNDHSFTSGHAISEAIDIHDDEHISAYAEFVTKQAASPPPLPKRGESPPDVSRALSQLGSKKTIALRLGYSYSGDTLNMGPFSIQLAADVLHFALEHLIASHDGGVAMPTVQQLSDAGAPHIAAAVTAFGGEISVGRRLGLVPQFSLLETPGVLLDDPDSQK